MFTKQKRTMSDPNSRAAAREAYVASLTCKEKRAIASIIRFGGRQWHIDQCEETQALHDVCDDEEV